ncbi:Hypothetical predicted protein [Olea europaea subsp. europaea]|uniref:Uncharacterized protein n=1 Tax=Olea europaea subsp. europaea TaxID=158383 RepID=A0A8S0RHH7_OLEEU|nr:Hypothetical predicted protein [Olea europaea subsp. europaea]
MAGYVESLVSTLVSNSKLKASVFVPDVRVEKENKNESLNEKHALKLENSSACDNRTQENVDQLDLDKEIRARKDIRDYGSKLLNKLARAGSAEPEGIRKEASLGALFLFACNMICSKVS